MAVHDPVIDSIGNYGTEVAGVECPSCGGLVVYNGNYFCFDLGSEHDVTPDGRIVAYGCGWAMPQDDRYVFNPSPKRLELELDMLLGMYQTRIAEGSVGDPEVARLYLGTAVSRYIKSRGRPRLNYDELHNTDLVFT